VRQHDYLAPDFAYYDADKLLFTNQVMIEPHIGLPPHAILEVSGGMQLNPSIISQYRDASAAGDLERTHLFGGRYENIYVPLPRVPALGAVLQVAKRAAGQFLDRQLPLAVGFWFNEMGPGHVTLPHRHDEDDELVSGVYYLQVPPDSGDLVLGEGAARQVLRAQAGRLILFPPNVVHEVTRNNSAETRLSIGMNFGPLRDGAD